MRPTFSIILFTVLSGAGFGLLFLAGLALAAGWPLASVEIAFFDDFNFSAPAIQHTFVDVRFGLVLMLVAGGTLATAGLLSSVGHLGKPLRAWRAFSQWRSSWLSREGVVSVATYVPLVALLIWFVFGKPVEPSVGAIAGGIALAIGAVATVYCTGHIYSTLKPIRAWHDGLVVPLYLLFALYTGALWMTALCLLQPMRSEFSLLVYAANALAIGPACAFLKLRYWQRLDRAPTQPDAGAATGLSRFGQVRSFEQPHTEENYLTREMGFVLARKHARRLRAIAFWLILLSPLALIPLCLLIGALGAWLVLAAGMLGVFVERWLFFAEARHAVIAFYDR
jgi:DMSO reductase anchor subunit